MHTRAKSFLAWAIAIIMVAAALPPIEVKAAPAGTPIKTVADLKAVANNLSGTYYLANDIDLGNAIWTPIGTASSVKNADSFATIYVPTGGFKGTFDGNGHVIKNLKLQALGSTITERAKLNGLFGTLSGATVKNLTIENINITFPDVRFTVSTGGIAGHAYKATIENCHVKGTIKGRTITETGSGDGSVADIGVIAYRADLSTISKCSNSANASALKNFAGIVYEGGASQILNCKNSGNIGAEQSVSGISAPATSGMVIRGCSNTGKLNGSNNIGIGWGYVIEDCYNTGEIVARKGWGAYEQSAFTGNSQGIGLAVDVVNGDVVKYLPKGGPAIRRCFNSGNISGNGAVGIGGCSSGMMSISNGVVTVINNHASVVEDCYNTGNIKGVVGATGIGGGGVNSQVLRCYNAGNISTSGNGGHSVAIGSAVADKAGKSGTKNCVVLKCSVTTKGEPGSRAYLIADKDFSNPGSGLQPPTLSNNYVSSSISGSWNNGKYDGTSASDSELSSADFYKKLGWDFDKVWKMSNGRPIFKWQK